MINWVICIAKRGRDEHFYNCLHYLNEANSENKYSLRVFVGTDDKEPLRDIKYPNMSVITCNVDYSGPFNKSKLLNCAIACSNVYSWNFMSVVDLDMVYSPNWMDRVYNKVKDGSNYVVSHGWKLQEGTQIHVDKLPNFDRILELDKELFIVGPSQVTMTKECYSTILFYFPGTLYNEGFLKWGGEDSVLSSMSTRLNREGKIVKGEVDNNWAHQYHVETKGEHEYYQENFDLYKKLHLQVMSKVL